MTRAHLNAINQLDEQAYRSVAFAQEEARLLAHSYVGTEHLLLGVLNAHDSAASSVLRDLGVRRQDTFEAVIDIVGKGIQTPIGFVVLTPRVKRILAIASDVRQARSPSELIRAVDLLAGVMSDPASVAMKVLRSLDVDAARLRAELAQFDVADFGFDAEQVEVVRASCPQCRAVLAEALATTTVAGVDHVVQVAYCSSCGWTLTANRLRNDPGHAAADGR
jgi:ATP-dependent Clp protease ATP-binding subunit ClpA